MLTLAAGCASWTGGREVSVVLRASFSIGDEDGVYPNMAMRVIVHDHRRSPPPLSRPKALSIHCFRGNYRVSQ